MKKKINTLYVANAGSALTFLNNNRKSERMCAKKRGAEYDIRKGSKVYRYDQKSGKLSCDNGIF